MSHDDLALLLAWIGIGAAFGAIAAIYLHRTESVIDAAAKVTAP